MPIYEFYCPDCHRIFNFFSRGVNVEKRPDCPRCKRPELERRVSLFAVSKGLAEPQDDPLDALDNVDEQRLEQAMAGLAEEAEGLDDDDPRQMGRLMRRLVDAAGLQLKPELVEAIRRIEAGEDPESVEEQMGGLFDGEDPLLSDDAKSHLAGLRRRVLPPSVDETLYDL